MPQTQWAPRTSGIAGAALAGLLLATGAAVVASDRPGRFLLSAAALGLLVFAAGSWHARPKLTIEPRHLTIRGWWHPRQLLRETVKTIRIREFRRIGRKIRLLEIETADDRLVILSRWDLGADPLDALDALTEAGYPVR